MELYAENMDGSRSSFCPFSVSPKNFTCALEIQGIRGNVKESDILNFWRKSSCLWYTKLIYGS